MSMKSLFLSYAGLDREIAAQVALGLKGAGVDLWWDREGIGWGDNWIQKLEDALTDCGGYVILVGPSGVRRWVKFELSLAIKRHIEQELPIFPLLLPGITPDALPPFLATIQAEALPEKLSDIDYGGLAQRLSRTVPGLAPPAMPPVPSDHCPFPGLEAFGEDDAKFFFGRQKETLDAVSCMGLGLDGVYRRWLQVEGTSGVGKSSLVKAGLIPTIKKGWAGSAEAGTWSGWRVIQPMRPGDDPLLNLAEALSHSLSHEAKTLSVDDCYRRLRGEEAALKVGLRDWVPSGEAVVLVIDQLEEVFTLTQDGKVRERFDALLAEALSDQDGPLHLITTIRSDFMMQFNALPRLQALLQEKKASRYLLAPIGEHGLKDVVRTPAKLGGLEWSDDQLPDDIVQEARREPGSLPLVENLLRLLWLEMRNKKSNRLSRQAYNELGGVGGALAKSADAILGSLGDEKQKALNLLMALVNIGGGQDMPDTRRTVPKAVALQAAGGGPQAEIILNQLSGLRGPDAARGAPARPRLVVFSTARGNDATTDLVDLAHETLLRDNRHGIPYWATFREEITRQRDKIASRQLAEALAKEWRDNGSSRWSGLATRAQRKAFPRLRDLSEEAAAYVQVSVLFAKRLVWSLTVVAILLITTASVVTWAKLHGTQAIMVAKFLLARVGLDALSPPMQEIPPGKFKMGDIRSISDRSEEQPVREVRIERPFKLGRYEVTFEEYDLFAAVTKRELPNDAGWGRGRRPVINVSWQDAKWYADWLSKQTGKRYRLPTEAEWEYAARSIAKNKDDIWAGTTEEAQLKEYAVYVANSHDRTQPVGGKKPNGLELYDMSGNVWELVEDCWHDNYKIAPTDGSAWLEMNGGDCGQRVIRGGSWLNDPGDLRASFRYGGDADYRYNFIGFRLAQDIDP